MIKRKNANDVIRDILILGKRDFIVYWNFLIKTKAIKAVKENIITNMTYVVNSLTLFKSISQ